MARRPITIEDPMMTKGDVPLIVKYYEPTEESLSTIELNLSELVEWLANNEGYLIASLEDIS
jgi:hypothetical protein